MARNSIRSAIASLRKQAIWRLWPVNEELLNQIEDLGLSEKEARVYVANLMLGPATVQKIADQAAIKRVTTYVILESLSGLGLVSQSNQGKKTFFTAEDPISLRRLLSKKEEQINEQKTAFESILPELNSLKSLPAESPNVKFYEGIEGIRNIVATFFQTHKQRGIDEVFGVSNLDRLYEFFPEVAENAGNPSRLESGVASKFLYTSSEGPIYKRLDEAKNRRSRYVPPEKYPFSGDFTIMGDHIVMLSLSGSKPIGVTIQSKELASSLRAIFDLAWEAAGTY